MQVQHGNNIQRAVSGTIADRQREQNWAGEITELGSASAEIPQSGEWGEAEAELALQKSPARENIQVSVWLPPLLLNVLAPLNGCSFEPWGSLKLSTEIPGGSSLCPSSGEKLVEEGISVLSIPQDTPVQLVVGAYFLGHNKWCFPKDICHLLGMIGLLKVRRFFSSLSIGCLV